VPLFSTVPNLDYNNASTASAIFRRFSLFPSGGRDGLTLLCTPLAS
jgi:hypothetical protein